jgi:FtsP/CotA-like multicopper oxidase with cupredoxin domain
LTGPNPNPPKVAITAQKTSITLPDGKTVPMWGYVCTNSGLASDPCRTAPNGWAPGPTIIVNPGSLEIDLTNALPMPTSIAILGQYGGGLGNPTRIASPAHQGQTLTTWPASADGSFTPPAQGQRVMSFGTEVGLNSTQSYTWTGLKPGTYLYETGTHPSIQVPMGLYGVLVVTNEPQASPFTAGQSHHGAFSGNANLADVPYDADQVLLLSEIDPVQNAATDAANDDESKYPHAVDYKPLYFLVNGKAFDRSAPSMLPVGANVASGNVLLRFLNAGLRTHIPSTVGLSMSVIAEDGNVLPGVPKIQSELLLTAGKTLDALVHPPVTTDSTTKVSTYNANVFPIFDRQLSLSNNNHADGGIQAYLQVAGGQLGDAGLSGPMSAQVIDDTFALPANATTFTNNVLANDIGITSAAISTQPQNGTVTMNPDGTFVYTPKTSAIINDSFTNNGNGNTAMVATVKLSVTATGAPPTAGSHTFISNLQSSIKVPAPGILAYASDLSNYSSLQLRLERARPPASSSRSTVRIKQWLR